MISCSLFRFLNPTQAHRAPGIRLRDLLRDVEEPNNVFFVFEIESLDNARVFINDQWARCSVAGIAENSRRRKE
jgi:hypothetical protein